MEENKKFVTIYEMLLRHSYHGRKDENGKWVKVAENEHLYRVVNYVLRMINKEDNYILIADLSTFTDRAFYFHRYLKNHIDELVLKYNPDLSHDQIDSHCIWSEHAKKQVHVEINKNFWGPYYNGRIYIHPRVRLFVKAINAKGKWRGIYCRLLQPIMWYTFKRSHRKLKGEIVIKNSEAHLWWLRCWALNVPWFTAKYNEYCIKAFGSVEKMFISYYKELDHPNLQFEKYQL